MNSSVPKLSSKKRHYNYINSHACNDNYNNKFFYWWWELCTGKSCKNGINVLYCMNGDVLYWWVRRTLKDYSHVPSSLKIGCKWSETAMFGSTVSLRSKFNVISSVFYSKTFPEKLPFSQHAWPIIIPMLADFFTFILLYPSKRFPKITRETFERCSFTLTGFCRCGHGTAKECLPHFKA